MRTAATEPPNNGHYALSGVTFPQVAREPASNNALESSMRPRTLAANILLPSGIAIATAVAWVWATGDTTPTLPAVAGLALAAAGLSVVAEWLAWHTVHAVRRRTRPARHRKPTPTSSIEGEA